MMVRKLFSVAMLTGLAALSGAAIAQSARARQEKMFLMENDAAMAKMMKDMSIKPTGDVDADFTAMMVPHHQGAIDMALAELRFGKNEQLRRIAQEIIVDQQQEIAAMRLAVGQKQPTSGSVPTAAAQQMKPK